MLKFFTALSSTFKRFK